MKINTKPVKCGDCSIIHGDLESLLIDCGSDNADKGLSSNEFAYSRIENHINAQEITYILISHFHKDHFNGILEIPDTYRVLKTYLPYSIIDGRVIYAEGLARLLAIAPSRSWGFQLSKRIMELFIKLDKISDCVEFLKKGDIIPFENIQIRILWPEVTTPGFNYGNLSVKIAADTSITNDREAYIFAEINGQGNNLSAIEEQLANDFDELLGKDNRELRADFSHFHERINTYLQSLHDNEKTPFETVYSAYDSLLRQRALFVKGLHPQKYDRTKYFARQQYHSLVTSMNAISIICDCNEDFLYLGDAPSTVVDYLHDKSLFSGQYKFVKIQHHGTPSHFTPNTPKGDCNVISNGGYFYRKVCEEYQKQGHILCTNAHEWPEGFCQFYDKHKRCPGNCSPMGNGILQV